jgi:hypothetical protein
MQHDDHFLTHLANNPGWGWTLLRVSFVAVPPIWVGLISLALK